MPWFSLVSCARVLFVLAMITGWWRLGLAQAAPLYTITFGQTCASQPLIVLQYSDRQCVDTPCAPITGTREYCADQPITTRSGALTFWTFSEPDACPTNQQQAPKQVVSVQLGTCLPAPLFGGALQLNYLFRCDGSEVRWATYARADTQCQGQPIDQFAYANDRGQCVGNPMSGASAGARAFCSGVAPPTATPTRSPSPSRTPSPSPSPSFCRNGTVIAPGSGEEERRMAIYALAAYDDPEQGLSLPWSSTEVVPLSFRSFVVVDHCLQAVVLCLRGTDDSLDVAFDFAYTSTPMLTGSGAYAHSGFSARSRWVFHWDGSKVMDNLVRWPGYRLLITGHSLGGAMSALLTVLFVHPDTSPLESWAARASVAGYGWATPGCVLYDPIGTVTSITNRAFKSYQFRFDGVARFSLPSVYDAIQTCERWVPGAVDADGQAPSTMPGGEYLSTLSQLIWIAAREPTRRLTKPGQWLYSPAHGEAFAPLLDLPGRQAAPKFVFNETMYYDHKMENYRALVDPTHPPPAVGNLVEMMPCPPGQSQIVLDQNKESMTPLCSWVTDEPDQLSTMQGQQVVSLSPGSGAITTSSTEECLSPAAAATGIRRSRRAVPTLPGRDYTVLASSDIGGVVVGIDAQGCGFVWHLEAGTGAVANVSFEGVGRAVDLAFLPLQGRVLVADADADTSGAGLLLFDQAGGPTLKRFEGVESTRAVAVDESGTTAYATLQKSGNVVRVDLVSGAVRPFLLKGANLSLPAGTTNASSTTVEDPIDVAVSEKLVYVLDGEAGRVFAFNPEHGADVVVCTSPSVPGADRLWLSDVSSRLIFMDNSAAGNVTMLFNPCADRLVLPTNDDDNLSSASTVSMWWQCLFSYLF